MTPTPEQAKAELERRASNKVLKQKGEPTITVGSNENGGALRLNNAELRKIAKTLTPDK